VLVGALSHLLASFDSFATHLCRDSVQPRFVGYANSSAR
jgi:hypothetical protein